MARKRAGETTVYEPKNAGGFRVLNFGRTATGKTASIATLLLAGQKVRFLSADNNAMAGIQAGMAIHKVDAATADIAYCIPERPDIEPEAILGMIDNILTKELDTIIKAKDKNRKLLTGFRSIYEGAITFKDTLSGTDYGSVLQWGADTTLVVDSLTVVCDEIRNTCCGNKPPTLPEWGQMQGLLKNFIAHLTSTLHCNVVLLAHPTKETDEVTGATTIYPLNLGKALSEQFASNFSDVLYSQFDGKKYFWATKHRTAVCSGRNIPIASELAQDYRQFFNNTTQA